MLKGETLGFDATECPNCGKTIELRTLFSGSSQHYIGYRCPLDGPLSRETHYFKSREEAKKVLLPITEGCDATRRFWSREDG